MARTSRPPSNALSPSGRWPAAGTARCGAGGGADLPLTGGAADTRQHVRLCFAFLEEAELREGVARLEAALTDARAAKRRLSPL